MMTVNFNPYMSTIMFANVQKMKFDLKTNIFATIIMELKSVLEEKIRQELPDVCDIFNIDIEFSEGEDELIAGVTLNVEPDALGYFEHADDGAIMEESFIALRDLMHQSLQEVLLVNK